LIRWVTKEHKVCLEGKGFVNFKEMVVKDRSKTEKITLR
jgi:hypothetical protein